LSIRQKIGRAISGDKPPEPEPTNYHELVKIVPVQDRAKMFAALEERVVSTVSKDQLETLYHVDALTFRDVNDYVDKVVGAGIYLEGEENLVKLCNEWLDNIKYKRLLEEGVKDIFVSGGGNGFYEMGYNEAGDNIPSVRILNPKNMDYIRNKEKDKSVELDDNGYPVGFIRSKDSYSRTKTEWTKDNIKVGDKVVWTSSDDQDGRDRIAHFKLFGLGESYLGHSPVETIYKTAIIRLNLEDNCGESAYRSAGIVATVGRENQPDPKPEVIDGVVSDLQNVNAQSVFGFPVGVRIDKFPSPDLSDRANLLMYFAGIQSMGMGIPMTRHLLPGSRVTMRGTDNLSLDLDYEERILNIQDRLAEQVREKFLYRMLKARGLVSEYSEVPKVYFGSSTPLLTREQINLISRAGRMGMLRRDPEVELFLRKKIGLPTTYIERELEQWKRDETKIPTSPQTERRDMNLTKEEE